MTQLELQVRTRDWSRIVTVDGPARMLLPFRCLLCGRKGWSSRCRAYCSTRCSQVARDLARSAPPVRERHCAWCGVPFLQPSMGRPRKWCMDCRRHVPLAKRRAA